MAIFIEQLCHIEHNIIIYSILMHDLEPNYTIHETECTQ